MSQHAPHCRGRRNCFLGTGDDVFWSDGNGNPTVPPAAQIANPNPLPGSNNQYTADGRFSNCSDPVGSPGALPIVRYLDSLGDELKPNCDSGYYYMLNDTNPGFLPNGQLGLGTGGFLLVDADDLEAATLGKGAQITFLPIA